MPETHERGATGDAASAEAARSRHTDTRTAPAQGLRRPGLRMLLACGALFLVVLDATIVSVALPAVGSALAMDGAGLGWVVNAY